MNKIALLIGVLLLPTVTHATDLPKRKPGLWEVTVTAGERPPQIMKQCTDESTDRKMMDTGNSMAESMGVQCSKKELNKVGDTYVSDSICTMNGIKLTSKTTFSGDFNSNYSGETSSSYDPPLMGMTGTQSKIAARWLGPCEAGQKPGDMVMPNGHVANIDMFNKIKEAAQNRPPAPGPVPLPMRSRQ